MRHPVELGQIELIGPAKQAPKRSPIKSVKVDQDAVHAVLTAFVKDTLGIDASVTKIVRSFEKSVELVLAHEAAA